MEEICERLLEREGNRRADPLGAVPLSDTDSDPDRLERRVLSRSAERKAARGGNAPARDGGRPGPETGARPSEIFSDGSRHGGIVRCHERGLWAALRGLEGRGGDA